MRQVLIDIPAIHLKLYGFGFMLCLAFLGAIGLAHWRARREKLNPEWVFDLAFAVMLGGIVGARLFYVVQYWGTGRIRGFADIFKIWEGGIVFYGGLIGAALAGLFVAWRRRMPIAPMADLVAPSVALGLALGRVGCFLNGCCYGDPCEIPLAVQFPPGSPPWWHQALDDQGQPTDSLIPGINREVLQAVRDGRIPLGTPSSAPVHPTQLYSAIDGLILLALLSAFYPLRRSDGEVMALLLVTYPITRGLIEQLRGDEPAFFAGLTVSQTVGIAIFAVGCLLWTWLRTRPPARVADHGIGT